MTNVFEVSLYVLTILLTLNVGAEYNLSELSVLPQDLNQTYAEDSLYNLQQDTGLREVRYTLTYFSLDEDILLTINQLLDN